MFEYIVKSPFGEYARGDTISQAQYDAEEANGRHMGRHFARVAVPDAPAAPQRPAEGHPVESGPSEPEA